MKGLICAGGEATRLGELTRVANKHLLPVGDWPMVYYPLQLLQLAGVREVLVVTGKGHAGQMIDLLGDGHGSSQRGSGEPLFDLDLTYKVQIEAGRDRPGRRHGREFAGGEPARRRASATTSSSTRRPRRSRAWAAHDGALVFVKEVPDPESFGVVVYGDDGAGRRHRREGRRRRHALRRAAVERRRRRSLLLPAGRVRVIARLEPSSRGELEITDVNRHYAERGTLAVRRVTGWWEDAREALEHLCARSARLIERDGRQQARMIDGLLRIPLRRFEDERGWFCELRREALLPKPTRADERLLLAPGRDPRPPLPRAGPGRPLRLPAGHGARRRARPRERRDVHARTSATTTRSRSTSRASTRTASRRSPICSSATTSPRSTTRPTRTSRDLLGRPAREAPVEHARRRSSPQRDLRARTSITGAGGQLGRALAEAFSRTASPR